MRVTIVGVCGSGKTELARRLAARGVAAHTVAQEHSHVPGLWRHEGTPDLLVYLSASARVVRRRGKAMNATELAVQRRRLADARRHADLRIRTDRLSPDQVERTVLAYRPGGGRTAGTL
jgi:cytidylate kinase